MSPPILYQPLHSPSTFLQPYPSGLEAVTLSFRVDLSNLFGQPGAWALARTWHDEMYPFLEGALLSSSTLR